uniref:Uncharacterized protein n=1 Tax=Candidatus Kentrum sp. LPFa TaxID=2126335 RepID=A0A450WDY6_9GAMM|nr:MAG: hypothetical protein BECKLPF1236B_GA0070989_107513 [Candidatus Kentron sp. LPFa]
MPGNPDLPRPGNTVLSKQALLATLQSIDNCDSSRARVLEMEIAFRQRITDARSFIANQLCLFQQIQHKPVCIDVLCEAERVFVHQRDRG